MPEITVSEEQDAFLESLRAEMQAETRYGYVRKRDALQYLIDNAEDDAVDVEFEVAPPSETDDGSTEAQAAAAVGDEDDEAAAETTQGDEDDAGEDGAPAEAADGGTTPAESSSVPDPAGDGDAGDDRLNAMMNLLDTHGDKWREANKEDARYEVDMPDGTTQYVQTKDDVRAHLFKNY